MQLFLYHEDRQSGPFSLEAVRDMVRLGAVPESALGWHEGAPEWLPLGTILAEAPPEPRPTSATCARPTAPATFTQRLPTAFTYPFRRDGLILLLGGMLFFGLLSFLLRWAILLGLIIAGFYAGYLFACMQKIIVTSAQGDEELPPWPDLTDFHQDIAVPLFQIGSTTLLCLAPGPVLMLLSRVGTPAADLGLFWLSVVLTVLGALYYPMALLAVAMADSLAGMSPMLVIPSILKVPGQYLVACGVLGLLVVGEHVTRAGLARLAPIPLLPGALRGFLSLYCLAVEMRILGLLYHTNRKRLSWF